MLEQVNTATRSKVFNTVLDLKIHLATTALLFVTMYLFGAPARGIWELSSLYLCGSMFLSLVWSLLTCEEV